MAQVEEVGGSKKRHISTSMTNFPRDLLQRFISANHLPAKLEEEEDEEDELELTLGLSLNGRFGVDPRAKKIKRTASIPEFVNPVRDEDMAYVVPMAASPLIRTFSLPAETEDEWRKRKELQTLRRMEARRKRLEKQRNSKAVREKNRSLSEEIGEEDNRTEQGTLAMNGLSIRGCRVGLDGCGLPPPPPSSQGSSGSSSNGFGSSGISESECQQAQGMRSVEAGSRVGGNLLRDGEQKSPITSVTTAENSGKVSADTTRNQPNKLISCENSGTREILKKQLLEDLPCVSTKGEGPNGKRIEGFLYRYRKGEEVRIVCVCHGSFLTPAEFVKHAGGGDVAHPLKHIVVSPSFL